LAGGGGERGGDLDEFGRNRRVAKGPGTGQGNGNDGRRGCRDGGGGRREDFDNRKDPPREGGYDKPRNKSPERPE
jgi:hypothetical protein